MAQVVKNPPAMQETWVQSLDWEDPLENSMDCIVHGVEKSQTQLSDFHFHYSLTCVGVYDREVESELERT